MYGLENYIVLDCETTNLDKGDATNPENKLVCISFKKGGSNKTKTIWGNEYEQSAVISAIGSCDYIVGHNIKFDLKWLAKAGLDLTKVTVYDTQIAEYVLKGNSKVPLDLGATSVRYGGKYKEAYIDLSIKSGVCPSQLPASLLQSRCEQDVESTELVFLAQRRLLEEQGLLPCVYTACRLTPCLADIELKGIQLDGDKVRVEFEKAGRELREIEQQLSDFTGGINPNSPKQLGEFLYDTLKFKEITDSRGKPKRTGAGNRLTDRVTISLLKATTKKQQQFIDLQNKYSLLDADYSKALKKFSDCVEHDGGLLYANFNQTRTRTHRLSSNGTRHKVQFQNLHRKFKPLFKSRNEGWFIGEADGAQLEFRVAAFLGQDKQAIEDIRAGVDVHAFTRDTITEAGQPIDRQGAKAHTFKPLYGGESGTEAEQAYYKAFKLKYNGIAETQLRWISEVLRNKSLRTCTGLTFHWPDTKIQRSGYVTNREAICNYPVQYFATGEIIPIAVVFLWKRMKQANMQSFLVNTVHDSAVAEIHPDERELFRDLAVKAFTEDTFKYLKKIYGIQFNVPLGCGIKIGTHWGTGQEEKHSVEPDTQ